MSVVISIYKKQKKLKQSMIALHKWFVTVRQIFSDDPAVKTQASLLLRRYSLSPTAAAWPCCWVLMRTAPLSSDSVAHILTPNVYIVNYHLRKVDKKK